MHTPLPILLPRPDPAAAVLIGYSGGLDSSVLLHLLASDARIRAQGLRALHVHHGLHPDADAWALHCRDTCTALDIRLDIVRVAVDPAGRGLEATARDARHAAFATALGHGQVLALAHHLDDQAETFLLRALRASGDGLGAMPAWRTFGHGWLWRPLLETPRATLLEYARAQGLRWLEDPSNDDDRHDRNFLRHRVMPLLRARWPNAAAAFARSARLARDTAGLLEADDTQVLTRLRGADPACLDAAALRALPPARRARVLRRWIDACDLPPLPARGIARIESELLSAAADAVPEFTWHGAIIHHWRGQLWAGRIRPPLPDDFHEIWHADAPLHLPDGGILSLEGDAGDTVDGWIVHARRGGERIVLPGRHHSHALKHVLQDLGVPPWQRAAMPLLSTRDGHLLAAGDLVLSARFDAWTRAHGCRLRWTSPTP